MKGRIDRGLKKFHLVEWVEEPKDWLCTHLSLASQLLKRILTFGMKNEI